MKIREFHKILSVVFLLGFGIIGIFAVDRVNAAQYNLAVVPDSAYPGEIISVYIDLMNPEAISGFDIVIHYDVSVLSIASISVFGTRAESFEYFVYRLNYRGIIGDIRINGLADIDNGTSTDNLAPGSGSIAGLSFYLSNNLNYAGYSVPIPFVFRDELVGNDNTLTDPDSVRIEQDSISYSDGYIKIRKTSLSSIGDVNLNGVTYEIGDIIIFTNFFISPDLFPLSPIQILNSDVNRDGYGATIADLVFMINKLLNITGGGAKSVPNTAAVGIIARADFNKLNLYYDSKCELGGLLLVLESPEHIYQSPGLFSEMEERGMIVKSSVDGSLVRLLIYSEDGLRMPSGFNKFLEIDNNTKFKISEIQLSSADGFLLSPEISNKPGNIPPQEFVVYQNYPNPFNPSTELAFDLSKTMAVRLAVFNILGQEVRCLIDGTRTGGHHTVVWDGRDNEGKAVSSGVYIYRLSAENYSTEKKMLLLK